MGQIRQSQRTKDDFLEWTHLWNACHRLSPTTPEICEQGALRRSKDGFSAEFFYQVGDTPVGGMICTSQKWYSEPGRYQVSMAVPNGPYAAEAEVALIDHGIRVASEQSAQMIHLLFDDLRPDVLRLVKERGYERLMEFLVTTLEVDRFDFEKHPLVVPEGFEISTLGTLESAGVDWKPVYFDAFREILHDVPAGEETDEVVWEDFLEMVSVPERFQRDSTFVALQNDRIVGLSELLPSRVDPSLAQTGLTGVRREFRRQGLATALKISAIQWALRHDIEQIATDNASVNPMYELNLLLGFRDRFCMHMVGILPGVPKV